MGDGFLQADPPPQVRYLLVGVVCDSTSHLTYILEQLRAFLALVGQEIYLEASTIRAMVQKDPDTPAGAKVQVTIEGIPDTPWWIRDHPHAPPSHGEKLIRIAARIAQETQDDDGPWTSGQALAQDIARILNPKTGPEEASS